jgi:hypothetical protein
MQRDFTAGDIFQIKEEYGRRGWIGALVIATDIKPWGVQGFIAHPETHEKQARSYIRLPWHQISHIGRVAFIPSSGDELLDHELRPREGTRT